MLDRTNGRSIPELLGDAIHQLSNLVHNEIQLARAEVSQKLTQAGMGAAFLAGAAVLMIPALVVLLISVALWLTQLGMSPVAAHLIAALAGGLVSVVLAVVGMNRLKPENLTPKVTVQQMERDVAVAKELAK